uniref:Uncharacterized protein n=1 Tax=Fagus sylvatica TaxID=28930 RepID=A0A2N9ESM8_FAGSY
MGLVVCVWVCRQCLGSLVVGWWFSVMVFSGSVGDGGSRRWWGFCLGLPAGWGLCLGLPAMGFPEFLSLFSAVCRQNGLWWVWVCRRGYGGCGFGFSGVWGLWAVAADRLVGLVGV